MPSVMVPSAWTDRALPSAWSRTRATGSASGGSCSTYEGATAVNGMRSCSRMARRCGDVEARVSPISGFAVSGLATEVPLELGPVAPAERYRVREQPVVEAVAAPGRLVGREEPCHQALQLVLREH